MKHTVPHVGVANVIVRQRKVLLHQRWGTHAGDGQWGFPGGKMELWEEFAETAERERIEECGPQLKVDYPRYWTTKNTMFKDEGKHFVVVFMVSRWISGEPMNMEPDKGGNWQWHDWEHLPRPLMVGIQQLVDNGECPIFI